MMVNKHKKISVQRQCDMVGLTRSSYYYQSEVNPEGLAFNVFLMKEIDRHYMAHPELGAPQMTRTLRREGHGVNPKRVARLMSLMGIQGVCPKRKKNTSIANEAHKKYPYLLKGLEISRPDQVWATDITYVPLSRGWAYLVAIMDWHSRYVISWQLSNTMENNFCIETLKDALQGSRYPDIFNMDQGSQFTSTSFLKPLIDCGISISMDGKGRAYDNIMIERLWRTVKYHDIYIHGYETIGEARSGLTKYFDYYNHERPHSSLGGATPAEVYGIAKQKEHLPTEWNRSMLFIEQMKFQMFPDAAAVALRAPFAAPGKHFEREIAIP
jgi:putative transposase